MSEILGWVLFVIMVGTAAMITLWMTGAIYYDVVDDDRWSPVLAFVWVGSVLVLFILWQPLWQPWTALVGVTGLFLIWWFRQQPSHDREWETAVAVLPRAVRDGDAIRIENVRNFEYRSLEDFTPRYESRTYHLANLKGVDVIFFAWGVGLVSHPVLVFDFGPDGRICMSIEVRFRKGQKYSNIRGFFRQQELIFVVVDERDIILRRTKHSTDQDAYFFHMNVGVEELRAVFVDYIDAINRLHEKPRWYHALCTNCTTSFYKLPSTRWRIDWRVIANGRLDRALYEDGRLDRSVPFDELRQSAYLNDIAKAAPEEGFGDYIRRELDRRRHE
jgi:hypothetical protein